MIEDLRSIAQYLLDMADEIEDGIEDEDDWVVNNLGLEYQIYKLNKIRDEICALKQMR